MTRGRRPVNAIDEALEIAGRRGSVEQVTGKHGAAFDFIIIEPYRNVFVKVKRSQTSFTYPLEILHRYQREIACLHRVALTSITGREFWVRSPKGTWQFFLYGTIPSWRSMPMACISRVSPFPLQRRTCQIPLLTLRMIPYIPRRRRNNPLFGTFPGVYPGRVNPGSLRAPFTLFFIIYLQKTVQFYTFF